MIAVVSNAWCKDDGAHADAYIEIAQEFLEFHLAQPGFRSRRLTRGIEDRTHFVNLRFFDAVSDYEAMIQRDGYKAWIDRMGEHVEWRDPMKEFVEVVLDYVVDATGAADPSPASPTQR